MLPICYKWSQANVKWNEANWTWDDCLLSEEIISEVNKGGAVLPDGRYPWEEKWDKDPEKKKKIIKLICKVKQEEYIESKEVKNIKISIDDVKLVAKAVSNVELVFKDNNR
jgi:hypothetical protein